MPVVLPHMPISVANLWTQKFAFQLDFFLPILIKISPVLLFNILFVCFVFNSELDCLPGWSKLSSGVLVLFFVSDLLPEFAYVLNDLLRTWFPHQCYYFRYAIVSAMWGLQGAYIFSQNLKPALGTWTSPGLQYLIVSGRDSVLSGL